MSRLKINYQTLNLKKFHDTVFFRFGPTIQAAKLPDKGDTLPPEVKGVISGYGDTFYGQMRGSAVLMAAEIPVQKPRWCQKKFMDYDITINDTVFCAGGEKDACQVINYISEK